MALADPADDLSPEVDFATLKGYVTSALNAHSEWYKEAREAFDFVAGHQWEDADELAMENSGRPPIKFNLVGPTINAVCGMEVNNRQQVRYLPRTMGETQINERLTSLADWVRDECQAEDEESAAFRDATICGRGATETRLSFDEEPTGKIVIDRRDPLECFVDPAATKANFADRKYSGDFRDIDIDEAIAMFPGQPWSTLNATWASTADVSDGGEGNKRDYPSETRAALRDGVRPKTVRIVRIQWWEREPAYLVQGQNGDPQQVDADRYEQLSQLMQEQGLPVPPAQRVFVRRFKEAFLGNGSILEQNENVDGFSLTFMTGTWDRNKRYHYGLVRPLLDPQRIVNKSLVQTHQILNTNAKGGLLIEKGAFANPRDAEKDWSDPTKTVIVADGAISGERIMPRVAPPLPPALTTLLELSMSSIRNVTGVNLEILGAADRDQAASLEFQRRQSAMSILAPLFDSLRRYRKTQGYVLIDCIRKLPPGVLVRVTDEQRQQAQPGQPAPQPQFQQFDPAAFGLSDEQVRFDVIVDEAPSSPNQKMETWAALQPFVPNLPPQALAVVLKYSPLPQAASQELAQAIGGQLPPEVQQQIQQGQQQIAQLTQENQQLKADRSVDQGKLQIEGFKAQTDRAAKLKPEQQDGGQLDLILKAMEQRFDAMEAQRDRDNQILLQHLRNAGQIAASRVRADATADQGIETNSEVGT
jgi:hypothetical protein